MTSNAVSVSESQRPRLHVAPPAEETFGDLAADFSADYGLVPDPWQRLVLDDWLARAAGQWASLSCGLSCPRQNGKNGIIEIRELFGMVGRGEKILHTAHEVKTARKAFKRLQYFFGRSVRDPKAKFPELNERVIELRNVNGQEAIYLENGGSVEIVARSKNSARGFTADVLIIDEAQEMSDEDLEALMPTTSAAPLGDPQWIYTGTPPGPKVNGEVFTRTRRSGLAGFPRSCWHEWSAADPGEPVDLDDRELWRLNNPGMDPGRLQIAVVEGERAAFSDAGFARERLGVWDAEGPVGGSIIDAARWAELATTEPPDAPPSVFAVDVSPLQASAAIAAGGTIGGVPSAMVVEAHPGVSWVIAKMIELQARNPGVRFVAAPDGPAGSLFGDAERAGVTLEAVSTRDSAAACSALLAKVAEGGMRHRGDPEVAQALEGATKRDMGDGAWLWSRKSSLVDICPLVAFTLALDGAQVSQMAGYYGDD